MQEIEEKLVRLVTISGGAVDGGETRKKKQADQPEGPQLPSASTSEVAQSQGDVDDLLARLGF